MKGSLRWIRVEVVGLVKAPAVTREPNRVRADAIFMVGWCRLGFLCGQCKIQDLLALVMLTSRKILQTSNIFLRNKASRHSGIIVYFVKI